MPKLQEQPPDRITEEHLLRVCAVEAPYGFICRSLAQTGLRWSEFTRATLADIPGMYAYRDRVADAEA